MSSTFDNISLSSTNKSIALQINKDDNDIDALIGINDYLLGSSNCNFVVKKGDELLLNIDDSNIAFNKKIELNNINVNNEAILYNTIIDNNLMINTSNVNINNDIILYSNIVDINKESHFNCNIYTDTLYVNNIDNTTGSNIIINNLELNQSIFNNPQLLNSIDIKRKTSNSSNIITINLENDDNLENILYYVDTIKINKSGEINIQNNININSNSIYLPQLSIDNQNHLTIGKTKNTINVIDYNTKNEWENSNFSLLHIHRTDTNNEYDIIKDPLLYITADYDSMCNVITQNYDQTELIFSNLLLTLESNITTENYNISLHFLPEESNAIWYSNNTQLIITTDIDDDPFRDTQINLKLIHYDYNNYTIFENGFKSTSNYLSDGKDEYNIDIYIGFYKTTEIKNKIVEITNVHIDNIGNNIGNDADNCNIGYYNLIESNYNPFENAEKYKINFDIHILYEKSDEIELMYFINTIPIEKECPLIMNCIFNNESILELNSNGLLTINDLNVSNAYIPDIIISNIHNNVSFMNYNITNVNELGTDTIYVINLHATTITTDNIQILGGETIQFTEIDTSNFNADFFKYNDERTNFLNEVTLCYGKIDYNFIKDYRSNNDISGLLISSVNKLSNINENNEDIAYFDGNIKLIGELQFDENINIKYEDNKLKINDDHIVIDNNLISLGNYFDILTTSNKIWLGDYSELLELDGSGEFSDTIDFKDVILYNYSPTSLTTFPIYTIYEKYFNTFYNLTTIDKAIIKDYANTFNINLFGNIRIASINNETIMELTDHTSNIDMIENGIIKSCMNVYGDIKCRKPFRFNKDTDDDTIEIEILNDIAFISDGDIQINGNIKNTSNIISEGYILTNDYIKTDEYVEAKKGVRNISDARVKYDLKKIENAVEKIKSLSGYTFKRNDLNGINDTGLLAQDVKKILPEVVNENKEGILSIEYSKMMGLIVEAIKELSDKIDLIK